MDKSNKNPFLKRLLVGASVPVAVFLLVAAGIGFYYGQNLKLKLSLTDLLPEDHPSVLKFDKITKIVGGVGYLTVVLNSEDGATHLKVAPSLVKQLESSPLVRSAFFDREEYFFASRMLYYLDTPELKKLHRTIKKSIRSSRSKALDLGLWDEEKKDSTPTEIDSKVRETAQESAEVVPHLISKDNKNLLLMVKPSFDSTDLEKTKALVAKTKQVLDDTLPAEVKYELAGRYYKKIADSKIIQEDIFILGTISLVLIALILLFYVRSPRAVVLIILPILVGIGITLGVAYVVIGHINIVTGFLLGILMGLGADYSIHLAFRLRLEKAEASDPDPDPVWRSIRHSGHAIFVGALAACLAFFLLCFSDFRAFSEFGFICGTGIGAVMVSLLFSFSGIAKTLRLHITGFANKQQNAPRFVLPQLDSKRRFQVAVGVSAVLCLLATRVGFEYDFSKMLQHSAQVQYLSNLVDEIYGRSATPSIISVPDEKTAIAVEDYIKEKYMPDVIDNVVSGATIVPAEQKRKQKLLAKIKAEIDPVRDKWLKKELDVAPKAIRRWVKAEPFGFEELPVHLQDGLRGKVQSDYLMVVYPSLDVHLHTAQGVQTFASMIRDLEGKFPELLSGSDAVVFAEILDLIKRDGALILAGILGMVGLIIWINLRSWDSFAYSFFPLILSFPIGMGLMALLGIKFNIFNIAIIPSFVAIGIDVPLHIAHRAREVRSGFKAARDLASAVNLTLATTGIGFGVLIFSRAGVLRSLGWLALLGTLSIWWVGLFILPALLERRYKNKEEDTSTGSTSPSPTGETIAESSPQKELAAKAAD